MKVSEMIKNLRKFEEEHGDLDCYYGIDDEGNAFYEVFFAPSLYYIDSFGEIFHYDPSDSEYTEEEVASFEKICVVN